jgi:hypothetical protein
MRCGDQAALDDVRNWSLATISTPVQPVYCRDRPFISHLQLPHERREIGNLPVFGKLPVRDSVELKGHRVNSLSGRMTSQKLASMRPLDAVQNGHVVSLRHHSRDRQRQVGESRTKPGEVALQGLASRTLLPAPSNPPRVE